MRRKKRIYGQKKCIYSLFYRVNYDTDMKNSKKIIFLLIPLVFFVLLLESGLRFFGDFAPTRVLCYDPILGRSYCANTKGYLRDNNISMYVEVNADGLLGKPYSIKRIPGIKRVAVLGDSFTSGEAVTPDKKFTGQWESKLAKIFGDDVEVINFGVGGTGTWQQLQRFHVKAKKYSPDLTVLIFLWGNDIDNNIDQFKSGSRNPLLDDYQIGLKENILTKRKNFNKWLWNNSALYQFTHDRYKHVEIFLKSFFRPAHMKRPELPNNQSKLIKKPWDSVSMYDDVYHFNSEGWELTKKLILKLQEEVSSNGSLFAVIQIAGLSRKQVDYSILPTKEFNEFLANHGIDSFDVFEYFGNWDASNPNFIPNDGHFSETGHRNFSKITLEFLVKSLDNLE